MNTAPIAPSDAPAWFQRYGSDVHAVIEHLLRENALLKARLKAAGISE